MIVAVTGEFVALYLGKSADQEMEGGLQGGQTERVSADLLATSVSKAVLAKEVLRLKQLRDELVTSTSDSPSALAERCKQLHLDIMEEEQRGAREIAELADQVCARARLQRPAARCCVCLCARARGAAGPSPASNGPRR